MNALQELKSKRDTDAIDDAILRLWFTSEPEEVRNLTVADQAAEKLTALRAELATSKEREAKMREALQELLDAYNTCQCGCDPDDKWHEARRALESSNE